MPKVIVAIPTFRRPKSLARLLEAVERLQTQADVSVLVADNDAELHEGYDLSQSSIHRGYGWPLATFVAKERGIAQVRNALVERALDLQFDFLAMIDDDEWPDAQWLDALLAVQRRTGADAVQGAVVREFEAPPSPLSASCDGLTDQRGRTGAVDMIDSTANVLVSRACFEALPRPLFDPAFAFTGGEDRDFFTRLKARGKKFAWSDEAIVRAFVPASRANLKWALARAYRVGNSDMRVFLKHRPHLAAMLREFAKIGAVVLLYPVLLIILSAVPNRAISALRTLCRAAGKIAAIFGSAYNEYSVIHGA